MNRRAALAAVAAFGLLGYSAVAGAKPASLSGTVFYRERMALPPGAVVEVTLEDVSRADAPAGIIARESISPSGQVPVPYTLTFDDAAIRPGRSYALRARILVDGALWFTSTTRHSIFAGGANRTDILVQRVRTRVRPRARARAAAHPAGRWLAEDIRGAGVIDRLQSVLEIAADGRVSGSGGCNRMSGRATITGDRISFGPLASTNMACTPAAMNQETKFFAALAGARAWRVDPKRRKLVLLDGENRPLVVFTRM
ncbi:YbaY family lipoprotein [Chelatococcus reniformis]|nr:YbaY family lipoprotein [Chelatococcus reniformis]